MTEVTLLLSVLAAVLPAVGYLAFIWWLDRYEREPVKTVLGAFLWGGTIGLVLAVIASTQLIDVLLSFGVSVDFGVTATIVAPVCEEPSKAIVLLLLLLGREFDNTTDGLVYGAATGLGFAMTENFLYFHSVAGNVQQWQELVLIRGSFTALMHCAASASFGAVLGRFRYRPAWLQWVTAPLAGLVVAVAIHASFNGLLSATAATGEELYGTAALGIVPVVGVVLFVITQLALYTEHKMIQRELEAEARAGVLPLEHARVIPFASKRRQAGWLAAGIDQRRYVKTATILAFRRHQARLQGKDIGSRNAEIHRLRLELDAMLAQARPGLGAVVA